MDNVSRPVIVATFKRGEAVPEWMFEVTPLEIENRFGDFCFQCDVVVIEAFGRYNIVAEYMDKPALLISGCENLHITATSVPVTIPTTTWTYSREEVICDE